MLLRHRPDRPEQRLQPIPAARRLHEAAVLHLGPRLHAVRPRIVHIEPALGQKAARQRSVGEELDPAFETDVRHRAGGASVEEGERNLVRDDLDAGVEDHVEVHGVEVREPEVPDQPFVLQLLEGEEAVEPARIRVAPGVELEEVDRIRAEPVQRPPDGLPHRCRRVRARRGRPLGEELEVSVPVRGPGRARPGDLLGRTVVVRHVERREARLAVRVHRARGGLDIDRALAFEVGDLPQSGQHPRDLQAGSEFPALRPTQEAARGRDGRRPPRRRAAPSSSGRR